MNFGTFHLLDSIFSDVLNDSPEHKLGVYIFETENGDAHENVSEIFEFMLQNEGNMCTIYTFTQCSSCNRIGTVNEKFPRFNFYYGRKMRILYLRFRR